MKILYISSVPSLKEFQNLKDKLKDKDNFAAYGMQESGFKFHHLIIDGIISDKKNTIYSLVGRPTSFKSHKKIIWKNKKEVFENITYEHIGYLNIPILKNIIVSLSYFFKTLKWIKNNKNDDKCIIIDASYITVIPFINLVSKLKNIKKVAIVCDIYEYMAPVKDARSKSSKLHNIIAKFMKKQYLQIDGFVFLTEAMNEVLNPNSKPYIVMEGLVDINMKTTNFSLKDKSKKDVIMYAGALREQYGLKNLVDGFVNYQNPNSELWVFGAGDFALKLNEYTKKDNRIKYFGLVNNEKTVKEETKATLLINPRPANQEFTKYSFPSKNMEYMVSGTPVLTSKLPGMPKEYYDYVYLIEDDNSKSITKSLEYIFDKDKELLFKKGKEAKKFVLENKNNIKQAERIIDLCNKVAKNDKRCYK